MSYLEMENHIFCSYGYRYGFHDPNDRHKLIHVWITLTEFGYILLKKRIYVWPGDMLREFWKKN